MPDATWTVGRSLRDTFAAAALTGLLADLSRDDTDRVKAGLGPWTGDELADRAYAYADAMLRAREAKG